MASQSKPLAELATASLPVIKPLVKSNFSSHRYPTIYDCCVLLVHCPTHQRVALSNSLDGGDRFSWFPYTYMSPLETWDTMRQRTLQLIFGRHVSREAVSCVRCLNVFRLQLPRSQRFVTRLIYYVRLNSVPLSGLDICLALPKVAPVYIEWIPIANIVNGSVNNIWGPEVRHYVRKIVERSSVANMISEHSVAEAYKVIPQISSTAEEEMLLDSKITTKDVQRLYDDYIEHLYPAFWMTPDSFRMFMQKHGFESDADRLKRYWNTFRFAEVEYMAFEELLLGLVAINRETPHCISRLKFIFRFYDQDQDGFLSLSEFHQLVQDINPKLTSGSIIQKRDYWLRQIKNILVQQPGQRQATKRMASKQSKEHRIMQAKITFKTFFKAVKAKIIVGTSKLCLAKASVHSTVARALVGRRIQQTFNQQYSFRAVITSSGRREKCPSCLGKNQQKPYRVAVSVVRLNTDREGVRVQTIKMANSKRSRPLGGHSVEVLFNLQSLPNLYIRTIGHFSRLNFKGALATKEDFYGLTNVVPQHLHEQFIDDVKQICKTVAGLVEQEPHIVELNSPVYVIGDIHGNIEDLLTLERSLWPMIPFTGGTRYLFLGDYVDRGKWGFECVLYLFCFKMLAPNAVTLLRGNHEERSLQNIYNYKSNLCKKYGTKIGEYFCELTNTVFDRLPVGAVVDNAIFGAHGGIPFSAIGQPIRDFMKPLPKVNQNPQHTEPPVIWELLWSDPAENLFFRDEYENMTNLSERRSSHGPERKATREEENLAKQYCCGYLPNRKRNAAYIFNELALSTFLAVNGFTHVIRAHEVPPEGYRLQFRDRCVTIFSCSHYCTMDNRASVIFAADGRLRIVQLDTRNNKPAMADD